MQTVIFELDKMAREYQKTHNDITIHSSEVFYPLSWNQSLSEAEKVRLMANSYTIHHYDTTWFSGTMLLFKRFLRMVQN